ncbi:putative ribonuclease H-like domain-containing protein [Tanacetum coccineum]
MTHPHPKRSFVPQAVLTRSGKLSTAGATVKTVRPVNTANTKAVNTVRPVNTAASKPIVNHPRPKTNAFKRGYSQSSRPFNRHFANKKSIINTNVNTARDYDGGFISFGDGKGRISGKGKIKIVSLNFDDVYFCKELKYNLFSVSQICDKKNNFLFIDTECLVLSSDFKLLDESQVLLRVPRKDNIYIVDLKSVVPTGGLTCLIAKATIDESNTWHRRIGHINFKTMNKLVKGNLVKGLPSKIFENDHSCVACQKGKQHKASYKTKLVNSISKPLHILHMDLFGPTNVKSLMKKSYCLVVTDDFSRFSWVFFLATKDETSGILKTFITEIENQLDHKVKVIRDHLGKFDRKADEGYFVRYYVVSKAMRVFNKRTKIVEETLNIRFLENTPNVKGNGPDWLFDVDSLTISMNYVPVVAGNQTNGIAGTKDNIVTDPKVSNEYDKEKPTEIDENGASDKDGKDDQATRSEFERLLQQEKQTVHLNSTNSINTVSTPVSAAGPSFTNDDTSSLVNAAEASNAFEKHLFEIFSPFKNAFTLLPVLNVTPMDDTGIFGNAYDDEDVGAEADLNNL